MSKKDYVEIARVIRQRISTEYKNKKSNADVVVRTAIDLADLFKSMDDRFNKMVFLTECGAHQ